MPFAQVGRSKEERELERQSIDDFFKEFHEDRKLHELKDLSKFKSNYESFLSTLNKDYLNFLLENHGIKPFNEIESNDSLYLFEISRREYQVKQSLRLSFCLTGPARPEHNRPLVSILVLPSSNF